MDKYVVHWTKNFSWELDEIYNNLFYFTSSLKIANRFYQNITEHISKLDLYPERYSKIFLSKNQKRDLRKIPIKNYTIIYEVDNVKKEIYILHIFHSSQNYQNKI